MSVLSPMSDPVLLPLGWGYGVVAWMRNRMFDQGWLRTHRLPVPVVSVGNLTAGGTGKTPMVAWVVESLQRAGRRPGVLARGYGRAPGEALNDEGRMLAELLPGLPQVQDPDRVAGGRRLVAEHHVDVVVMDDGFQHRRLHRDYDLVCLDAHSPFGGGACLPAGRLRESAASLARAHAVVVTRSDRLAAAAAEPLMRLLRQLAPRASLHKAVHSPQEVVSHPDRTTRPPESLQGARVFLLSALGNPAGFLDTVASLGASVAGHATFRDHHRFTPTELARVAAEARAARALVLTTDKDQARLSSWSEPHAVLRVRIAFLGQAPAIEPHLPRRAS